MQFSLRFTLGLVGVISLGLAFLAWQGFDFRSYVLLFLMAVIPAAIALERFFQPPPIRSRRWSRQSLIIGVRLLLLFGLLPAAVTFTWHWLIPDADAMPPFLLFVVWIWIEFVSARSELLIQVVGCVVPAVVFVTVSGFVLWQEWPRPIPLRVPILLATFSSLSVLYFCVDWPSAKANHGESRTVGLAVANFTVIGVLWALWWWWRASSTRAQGLLVSALMFCWLFGLAFPMQGDLLIEEFFDLKIDFGPGPAPVVDRKGWAQMRKGLTESEVEQLLGGRGHVSGGGTIQVGNGPEFRNPVV